MARILIVNGERELGGQIARELVSAGHTVLQADSAAEALEMTEEQPADLIIADAASVGTKDTRIGNTPMILMTALDETAGTVSDLVRGADDCIVKPFEMPELLFRAETVLRRSRENGRAYRIEGLEIDFGKHIVKKDGVPIELTLQEYALLETLIKNRNVALSRQRLMREAWNIAYMGETRTVDVHVQRLRRKLGMEDRIKTVYKYGYRFEDLP